MKGSTQTAPLLALGAMLLVLGNGGLPTTRLVNAADYTFQVSGASSTAADISADGRYVVFESLADDLVENDTNGVKDIFLHDRDADNNGVFDEHDKPGGVSTSRINVDSDGNEALGGHSANPAISADGRYVVFQSLANNLVGNDTNGVQDIFLHDRDVSNDSAFDEPGDIATILVSVTSDGVPAAGGHSTNPDISGDGRHVVFQSLANNLVVGTAGVQDIFVHDRDPNGDGTFDEPDDTRTVQVSVDSNGVKATDGNSANPVISYDGRFVAFESNSINLVDGTAGVKDIFVHDRDANGNGIFDQQNEPGAIATVQVSVNANGVKATGGNSANPAISYDGRFVAFHSTATDLVAGTAGVRDVFVHDRDANGNGIFDQQNVPGAIATVQVSVNANGVKATDGNSANPAISYDGRFVAFESNSINLVDGTTGVKDIFVHDRDANGTGIFDQPGADAISTVQVSVDSGGSKATTGNSANPAISYDGRFVVFQSAASDLVAADTNGMQDIFVHDRNADDDLDYDEQNQSGAIATVRVSVRTVELPSSGGTRTGASPGGSGSCFVSSASHESPDSTGCFLLSVLLGATILLPWILMEKPATSQSTRS